MKPAKTKPAGQWLEAWHVNPSVNRDYDFIDGLRGVAILMVLAGHHLYFNPQSGHFTQFMGNVVMSGGHGVSLFFALSGFLISWPFWKRKFTNAASVVPPGYGWRRFWKIYPPLALSVLIFTPCYIAINQDWSYCTIALQWLAGLPFLLPVSGKLNPVTWTLVIEVQFYVVLALVFLGLKKMPSRICLWVVPLLFLVVPCGYRLLTGLSAAFHPDINSHFPSALDAFALGILVAGLENAGLLKKNWARLGMVGLMLWPLTLLVVGWLQMHPAANTFAAMETTGWLEKIASGCLLCYVAQPQHPVAQWLCAPWLRWCGIVSYEWYLFHQPITLWTRHFIGHANGDRAKYIIIVAGSFLASMILTALIYRFFSLPILKYGRASAGKKNKSF